MNYLIKAFLGLLILCFFLVLCKPFQALAAARSAGNLKTDSEGYYLISSREDFNRFIKLCRDDSSVNGRLKKDIILNDDEAFDGQNNLSTFESIYEGSLDDMKGYSGDFDGDGHSLTGYVSCENLPVFFIIEKTGCVHDLTISNSVFSPTYNKRSDEKTEYSASIAELNYGTIKDCTVEASVVGRAEAAGIAGVNESSGLIRNTFFSGNITGGYGLKIAPDSGIKYAYDLVVINNGKIDNCKADAIVKTVAGLATPYTLSGKRSSDSIKTSDDDKSNDSKTGSKDSGSSKDTAHSDNKSSSVSENSGKSGLSKNSASEDDDYIGPDKDTVIQLVKGDTLWHIARVYYGRGIKYTNLKLRDSTGKFGGLEGHVLTRLQIGTDVFIPRLKAE